MSHRDFNFACGASAVPSWAGAHAVGSGAAIEWPPIALLDVNILASDSSRGQPAVVVFRETFCPFCKQHNAHLNKLFRATRGQRLRILSVPPDADERVVRRYMKASDYVFAVDMDGSQLRQRLTSRRVVPMTCQLDRRGRLVQVLPGKTFEEDVMEFARLAA